jgi:hypothetical protein
MVALRKSSTWTDCRHPFIGADLRLDPWPERGTGVLQLRQRRPDFSAIRAADTLPGSRQFGATPFCTVKHRVMQHDCPPRRAYRNPYASKTSYADIRSGMQTGPANNPLGLPSQSSWGEYAL